MRILFVNKFGYLRGGLERVMFDEMRWLAEEGHDTELFATAHPDNRPFTFADRFPPYHEFGVGGRFSAKAVRAMFWNKTAARAVGSVIDEWRPDVVHCHGIHRHLSPSVLAAAHEKGVPVVLSAHDYFLVCPANTLLRGGTTPCLPRACGVRLYGAAARNRCVQHSLARSTLAATEISWQRLRRRYERGIDAIVSPSRFLADVLADGGFDASLIHVVPNAVLPAEESRPDSGRGFLIAGRVSPEKGIDVAVDAARAAGVTLRVAGDGPDAPRLAKLGVTMLGRLPAEELYEQVRSARAVVVPSVWFENAPMAVLEAMAAGTPVIASAIGGIPEQIEPGVTGLLVPPHDVERLADAMARMEREPGLSVRLGEAARAAVRDRFSPELHVEGLMEAYRAAGAAV